MAKPPLRAIDLYSGVGGWSLGLQMAGIKVISSYERLHQANETNLKNNRHQAQTVDIRNLQIDELPADIDIVVGSPPCTQFSFSNRGGNGDIADGLEDVVKFLSIVDHLKPRYWAMENVPRLEKIMKDELKSKGRLSRFSHLNISIRTFNMEKFGLPQRRQRCIVGNFDHDLLSSYAAKTRQRTLGETIEALATDPICDPIFGLNIAKSKLYDHVPEEFLNAEETRINRAGKIHHHIYNSMPFPDRLDRSVRTITATCTRVSRESIIIRAPGNPERLRRLTVRERATLQGFPVTFQFCGTSYAQKLRMIGNAIPPLFSFYIAQAFKEIPCDKLPTFEAVVANFKPLISRPPETLPDSAGKRFRPDRTFRFVIPNLRLKSGVRFELANSFKNDIAEWAVAFYFGSSKSIQQMCLDLSLFKRMNRRLPRNVAESIRSELDSLSAYLQKADIKRLQNVWSHTGPGGTRPFALIDRLGEAAGAIAHFLRENRAVTQMAVTDALNVEFGTRAASLPGLLKLTKNSSLIVAGLLVGSLANTEFDRKVVATKVVNRRILKTTTRSRKLRLV